MSTTSDSYVPFYLAIFGKSNGGPPNEKLSSEVPIVEISKDSNNHDILSSSKENDNPRSGSRRTILPTPEMTTINPLPNTRSMVPSLLTLDVQRPKSIFQEEPGVSNNSLPPKIISPPSLLGKINHSLAKNKNFPKKLNRSGRVNNNNNNNNNNQKFWRNDRRANNSSNLSKPLISTPITNTCIQNPYTKEASSFFFNNTIQGPAIPIHQQKHSTRQYNYSKGNMNHPNNKNGTNIGILKQGMIKKKDVSKNCHNNDGKYVSERKASIASDIYQKNCSAPNVKQFNTEMDHIISRIEPQADKAPSSSRKPLLPAPFINQQ